MRKDEPKKGAAGVRGPKHAKVCQSVNERYALLQILHQHRFPIKGHVFIHLAYTRPGCGDVWIRLRARVNVSYAGMYVHSPIELVYSIEKKHAAKIRAHIQQSRWQARANYQGIYIYQTMESKRTGSNVSINARDRRVIHGYRLSVSRSYSSMTRVLRLIQTSQRILSTFLGKLCNHLRYIMKHKIWEVLKIPFLGNGWFFQFILCECSEEE